MKLKINDDKGYNGRRSIAITHRKGREERKAEGQKSLRPLRSLRLMDLHGIPTVQGNKAMIVFQTGFTGSTGCVLSLNPVMWLRLEKTQINAYTLTSSGVEYLLCRGHNKKRRYGYNTIINIFQPEHSTTSHRFYPLPKGVCT